MKANASLILLLILSSFYAHSTSLNFKVLESENLDSTKVNELNKLGYDSRLIDPDKTIFYAEQSLSLAKKINFLSGIGEAYRVKGIGLYYKNNSEQAIDQYQISLSFFEKANNQIGIAKVNNNIGNLYINLDYDKSLEYFNKALTVANSLGIKDLLANLYLNMGTVYWKKKFYTLALSHYKKSTELFNNLNNQTGLTLCLQNLSAVYENLNQLDSAEVYALKAIKNAKQNDLNFTIASTNLTLSDIYISTNRLMEAEKSIKEGIAYSKLIKDSVLQFNYLHSSYELESKRNNYKQALYYLREVYVHDSLSVRKKESERIGLYKKQKEREQESELMLEKQKVTNVYFGASIIVSGLLIFLSILLVNNNRKKARTNEQLTALNQEIILQKENLDKVNRNLETTIDERTKDLKIKNQKLSQYSSHLSHQIRGPVATLKGLLNLERENLIEMREFIVQAQKCVNDIDDKILNINEMLQNPQQFGFDDDVDQDS